VRGRLVLIGPVTPGPFQTHDDIAGFVFLDSCLRQRRTEQVAAEPFQAFTVGGSRTDVRVEVVAVDGRASSRQGFGAPGNSFPSSLSTRA
jgi:hypothetical protein